MGGAGGGVTVASYAGKREKNCFPHHCIICFSGVKFGAEWNFMGSKIILYIRAKKTNRYLQLISLLWESNGYNKL